jgi:hypothetical protein
MDNPDDNSSPAARGAKGGNARARNISKERRSEIGRQGGLARHAQDIPRALTDGWIDFAGRKIAAAVLETKMRVLTQETMLTTMGRAAKAKGGKGSEQMLRVGGLPPFLAAENLLPFISDELRQAATPVVFRTKRRGTRAYGYDARLLPLACEVYLKARDAHLQNLKDAQEGKTELRPVLLPAQERLVQTCDMLMRAMAKEHIITLVDRATGYEDQTVRDEILKQILIDYIAPNLQQWTERFPTKFFWEVYRIHGWPWVPGSTKRPQYVGKFINTFIYEMLPEGVLDELKRINPVQEGGHRSYQHHRFMTNTGNIHLDRQITKVITIMELSENKVEFKEKFWQLHRKQLPPPETLKLAAPKGPKPLPLFPQLDAAASAEPEQSA